MRLLFLVMCLLTTAVSAAERMTFLSYNVFFDDPSGEIRYPQIIAHITSRSPDIVCLQECTPTFLALLKDAGSLRDYTIYPEGQTGAYFNLILSKRPTAAAGVLRLPSRMGRSAPFIDVDIQGTLTRLYCIHLESLEGEGSVRMRSAQLLVLVEHMQKKPAILVGDFNFSADAEVTDLIPAKGEWEMADEPTFDPVHNPLARETASDDEPPRRLDRIHSLFGASQGTCIRELVFYSDHYPILGEFATGDHASP